MADFTISEFLSFCRSKPADRRYTFCDSRQCALAQFGAETGRPHLIGIDDLDDWGRAYGPIALAVYHALNPREGSMVWGDLADRLEALLPAEPRINWLKAEDYLGDYALAPLRAEPVSRLGADARLPLSQSEVL